MQRRFVFRLERVQRIRALEERVARAERVAAEHAARAAEQQRDLARAGLERSRARLSGLLSGALDARRVLQAQRLLDLEQRALARSVESARTGRSRAEHLAALHRERRSAARALEELRTRALARHRQALGKADDAALDEVAQNRHRNEETDSRPRSLLTDDPARTSGPSHPRSSQP